MITTPKDHLNNEPGDEVARKTCRECSQPFEIDLRLISRTLANCVEVCPDCSEKHSLQVQRDAIDRRRNDRLSEWENICPEDFQETKRDRLPMPEKLEEVLAWNFGPKGLILHGPTGCGKSRCAWRLLAREFNANRSVGSMGSMAAIEYAARYTESAAAVEKWMDSHINVKILLLDDVFKSKLTDSFEMALFSIITLRTERKRPIILTSNDTPQTLMQRMSPDRAAPMMRRLIEYSKSIPFVKPASRPVAKAAAKLPYND